MFTTLEEAIKHYDDEGCFGKVADLMDELGWTYAGEGSATRESLLKTVRELGQACLDDPTATGARSGGWVIEHCVDFEGTGHDLWEIRFDILSFFATESLGDRKAART